MLALLLWNRPYARKSGNWINTVIQVVRVLSIVCILVFVEELGVAQTTKTVTGVVLIAMQSALTGALAILIVVNAVIICCKENPHRKRRKEAGKIDRFSLTYSRVIKSMAMSLATNSARLLSYFRPPSSTYLRPLCSDISLEKLSQDLDNLTPLDARNSLLMKPPPLRKDTFTTTTTREHPHYNPYPIYRDEIPTPYNSGRGRRDSRERLIPSAAGMPYSNLPLERSTSADSRGLQRQPTIPNVGL